MRKAKSPVTHIGRERFEAGAMLPDEASQPVAGKTKREKAPESDEPKRSEAKRQKSEKEDE